MKGHRLSDIWFSDSKEFALSWRDDSDHVHDCGKELTISDQGYAVISVHRIPRAVDTKIGLIASNQLAVQLIAVEDNVGMAVSALFRHALSALCDRTNLLALSLGRKTNAYGASVVGSSRPHRFSPEERLDTDSSLYGNSSEAL
ncbi:hypothetical protein Y032_0012g1742 [Ancylostoma ceylanicum]|uniref:Uncharacterized protein n=1 Tax=Ancylostoma ceylanicum TaxID=53326 RepID=A0A016VD31_9BILA|nr:hypothetical protein Y032_0012g1742 [Ancylostoma ceylanicum]